MQFGTRLKEHQKAVSNLKKRKSALTEHVRDIMDCKIPG
jgi:hypothetical protein